MIDNDFKYYRPNSDYPYKALAARIILQSIFDLFSLRKGRIKESPQCNIKELYDFFHSEWFYFLSNGMDGERLWKKLNQDFENGLDYDSKTYQIKKFANEEV